MSRSRKTRAVVLLSGGMDSAVCAALATRDFETAALHISYGQRTQDREQQSFLGICEVLRIRERLIVRNEALRAIASYGLARVSAEDADTVELSAAAIVPAKKPASSG